MASKWRRTDWFDKFEDPDHPGKFRWKCKRCAEAGVDTSYSGVVSTLTYVPIGIVHLTDVRIGTGTRSICAQVTTFMRR